MREKHYDGCCSMMISTTSFAMIDNVEQPEIVDEVIFKTSAERPRRTSLFILLSIM